MLRIKIIPEDIFGNYFIMRGLIYMLKAQLGKQTKVNDLVKIGVLAAIAAILMFLEFMVPLMPVFLKLDLSDVPALIGAFALGPVAGIWIQLIKNIVHAFATTTYGIGEFANFIVGIAYVIPAGLIYQRRKDRVGAMIGLVAATIIMCIVAGFMNYYVFIPLYQTVLNWPMDAMIALGTQANAAIVDLRSLIVLGILPFNLLKGFLVSVVTVLIYKKVSPLLHR